MDSEPTARSTVGDDSKDLLIDVSRLIWRFWTRRLPTGVDRVCLAYLEHFGGRARAVIQRRGVYFVLSPRGSARLFAVLQNGRAGSRTTLILALAAAMLSARRSPPRSDMLYLNTGHTGLDEPSLPAWIAKHRIRAVYLIHDLIPITHPQFCRPGEAEKHRLRLRNALASAHGIIANSGATLTDIEQFAEAEVMTMPPAVTALIGSPPRSGPVEPRSLTKPYFVALGTIEGRKNHLLLLNLWRRLVANLGDRTPLLLVIGQRGWEAGPALAILDRAEEFKGAVRELGDCNDDELAGWVAGARALLMPSFAEGFGLPVIEALQLGTPVIASDLAVYREIAGGIPTYRDPSDGADWERAVRQYIADSPDRRRQIKALRSYRAPDWASHFTIVEEWLARLKSSTFGFESTA